MSQVIPISFQRSSSVFLAGAMLLFIRFRILPGGWEESGVMPPAMSYWQMGWQLWPEIADLHGWPSPAKASVLWLVLVGYPVFFLAEGWVLSGCLRLAGWPARAGSRTVFVFLGMRFIQGISFSLPLWSGFSEGPHMQQLATACPMWILLLLALLVGTMTIPGFYPFSTFFKRP